ncbi:MAG: transcription antitermination factor NusB [Streptococcaceae bacterium]|jgi:N utilization substance protein B|nr:transcription antitermination factor NusB [Streptococcaceae bacterium]
MPKSMERSKIREKAIQALYFQEYYFELQSKMKQQIQAIEENSFFNYRDELSLETADEVYAKLLKRVKAKEKGFRLFLDLGFESDLEEPTDRIHLRILEKLLDRRELELEKAKAVQFSEELTSHQAIENALALADFDEQSRVVSTIPEYLSKLVEGVLSNINEIDTEIKKYLSAKWTIERLSKVDKSILRLGVYELKFGDEEVAGEVVIDEAVELSKKYSDEKSAKFINGVLDTVFKQK